VADWVCPAGTGCGYPKYSHREGAEYGYVNLAVFYEACSFDCLFCQNWHYRSASKSYGGISAATLAEAANDRTACICYFGGDPAPQALHALEASRLALENRRGHNQGILRICWETNGSEAPAVLDEMLALSLESGGCVKFDLKACNENLHQALCGPSNRRTLENFRRAARRSTASFPPPFSPQATEGGNTRRVNDFCSGKSSAGSTMTRHVAPARTPF
jgi:pyruvate formate lyase activating enzyme